ncbi:hypothetical protein EVAR_17416_1 [Eumeta japonica]|uniref:Uncharacterized protein n=1 Tax=Eumeta variegata TaxID=151549 RepID=A0A4C1VD59_EUMVA|nr:hypothetical protein EVAR_17416_1 [Eumeta japonica]
MRLVTAASHFAGRSSSPIKGNTKRHRVALLCSQLAASYPAFRSASHGYRGRRKRDTQMFYRRFRGRRPPALRQSPRVAHSRASRPHGSFEEKVSSEEGGE